MEPVLFKDNLQRIYDDMMVRIELGVMTMDEPDDFMANMEEAVKEKFPDVVVPDKLDLYSVVFGVMYDRITREYFKGEWW